MSLAYLVLLILLLLNCVGLTSHADDVWYLGDFHTQVGVLFHVHQLRRLSLLVQQALLNLNPLIDSCNVRFVLILCWLLYNLRLCHLDLAVWVHLR